MAQPTETQIATALRTIGEQAAADTIAVLRAASSIDDLVLATPGIIEVYSEGAAALAADHYDDLRETARAAGAYRAVPIVNVREEEINRGVRWATQPLIADPDLTDLTLVESRLTAVVTAETARPFRETILTNTATDPEARGWSRHAKLDGCKFCRMLASRGAVYRTTNADFAAHPRCSCTAVPAFSSTAGPDPDTYQLLASQPTRTADEQALLNDHLASLPDVARRTPARPVTAPPPPPAPNPAATSAAARVGGRPITATDPKIVAEARRRNLDPVKLAETREAKRIARLEENMRARAAARNINPSSPDVIRLADKYGISPDDLIAARVRVADLRKAIASEAAETHAAAFDRLYQWNITKVRNPSYYRGSPPAEYDWTRRLDQGEIERLRRKWFDNSPDSAAPDVFAELLGQADPTLAGASVDDVMQEWLETTRRYEASSALRQGKLPSGRAYSNEIDAASLVPRLSDEGYDVFRILGTDDLEAAAHIARVDADLIRDDAAQYLEAALNPQHGPAPYRMSYQAWEEEVRDLETAVREGYATTIQTERVAELVPRYLDEPDLSYEMLYDRIHATARQAGLDVIDPIDLPRFEPGYLDSLLQ